MKGKQTPQMMTKLITRGYLCPEQRLQERQHQEDYINRLPSGSGHPEKRFRQLWENLEIRYIENGKNTESYATKEQ